MKTNEFPYELKEENIVDYRTKQEGYGRQGVYLTVENDDPETCFPKQEVYVGSVFPNLREQFHTDDEVFYDEENDTYTDSSGNEVDEYEIFNSTIEYIYHRYVGTEVYVTCEEPDEE